LVSYFRCVPHRLDYYAGVPGDFVAGSDVGRTAHHQVVTHGDAQPAVNQRKHRLNPTKKPEIDRDAVGFFMFQSGQQPLF